MRIGISVECAACHRYKAPRGRDVAMEMANSMCNWECPGYIQDPQVGSLWPGETDEQFGYPVGPAGTRGMTPDEFRHREQDAAAKLVERAEGIGEYR